MIHLSIKEVALNYGYTLKDICEKAGYKSLPSFYRQINNPESLTMNTLIRIANAIGCKVGDFFIEEMTENTSNLVGFHYNGYAICPHCKKRVFVDTYSALLKERTSFPSEDNKD